MTDTIIGNILSECVKCGRCLAVCPVYNELRSELYSSRGRIALLGLLENEDFIAQELKEGIDKCLVCLRCRGVCEKDVKYLDLISMVKAGNIKKSFADRVISRVLMNAEILTRLSRMVPRELFSLLTKEYADSSFFYLKLVKLPVSTILPNYYRKPAYTKKEIRREAGSEPKYLYFPGCGSNIILPGIAQDTISLLDNLDIPFVIPEGLACCGFPLYYNGFDKKAEEIKKKNLDIFKATPHESIITTCPTCRTALIEWYGIDGDRVRDISEVMKDYAGSFEYSQNGSPAYHQPCHFSGKHPVRSASSLLNTLKEDMPVIDSCCGGGGSFFVKNSSLSLTILKATAGKFEKPSAVISSCPLCMLRLADGMHRYFGEVRLLHLSSFLLNILKMESDI